MASSVMNNIITVFGKDVSAYFTTFGFLAASYWTLKVTINVIKILKSLDFAGSTNFKNLGSWAVVTGSTDGIGKGYAKELAQRGVNIVLISRLAAKLQEVASEIEYMIEKESKVQTRIIVADFSKGLELYDFIRNQFAGLEIGTLVFFIKLINVNITSVTMMTSIVMPAMVERKKGAVINISSGGGVHPVPLQTVYSACKCVMPYFVVTNMNKPFYYATKSSETRKPSLFEPSPTTYAKAALDSVGVSDFTNGYWAHDLQGTILDMLPEGFIKMLTMSLMKKVRKINLERMSKKKD